MKKHLSFDIWGSLIESNPEFKIQQAKLAKATFGISEESFLKSTKRIKNKYDILVESTGKHFDRLDIWNTVLDFPFSTEINFFIKESDKLFLEYRPFIKSNVDLDLLHHIINNNDCFVTSNTVMIYSDVLSIVVSDYFNIKKENMIFSDMVGISKPNLEIFKKHKIKLDYHIGDNHITDKACEKLNIKFIDINKHEDLQILS